MHILVYMSSYYILDSLFYNKVYIGLLLLTSTVKYVVYRCVSCLHIHVQRKNNYNKGTHIICYVVSFMKPKDGTKELRFSDFLCLNYVFPSHYIDLSSI